MVLDPSQDPAAIYGLTQGDAQRVREVVRYVETVQRSRPAVRARWPIGGGGSIVTLGPAKADGSGITARSTAGNGFQQTGTGNVTLLQKDVDGYLYVPLTAIALTGGGSGYTNGTHYALTITSGSVMSGKDAQGLFDVVANAVVNVRITDGGEYLPGGTAPTVAFSGAGGSGATSNQTIGTTVTCNSDVGSTVGANHYLMVGKDQNGDYWVLAEDCP